MKHLKLYEEFDESNETPDIGDYVVCIDTDESSRSSEINKLLSENIGKIIAKNYTSKFNPNVYPFLVEFEDIKIDDEEKIESYGYDIFQFGFDFEYEKRTYANRVFNKNEIVAFSKNKKDLEPLIIANKFNL